MSNCVCVSEQQWGMFADCLGSFERGELLGVFLAFFFSLVWLTARDSLSVWTVSLKDEKHYHDCVQAAKGVHAPVLTATWQRVLSGTLRERDFFFLLHM